METLFYIVCFFPFINWIGIGGSSDIQPYCMIITFFLLIQYGLEKKIILNRKIANFYAVVVLGIVCGLIATVVTSGFEFSTSIRYLATYISLILVSCYTYLICKNNEGFDEKKIKIVINIYLVVGIIQLFQREFLYGIISNARTTGNRGVVSLTSEPSFYGYMCVFFMILVLDFKKNRNLYIINLLLQICFIAKSSITILYLVIFIFLMVLFSLKKINIKGIVIAIMVMVGGAAVGYYYIINKSGQRMAFFINTILSQGSIKDVVSVLLSDYSVSVRVNDIKVCLEGFIEWFGIPQGFDTRKISSGYGSLILSMGWIGVIVISHIYIFCITAYDGLKKKVLPIFITIIMFSAIQVANPVFAFLIGYFMFLADKRKMIEKNENG